MFLDVDQLSCETFKESISPPAGEACVTYIATYSTYIVVIRYDFWGVFILTV